MRVSPLRMTLWAAVGAVVAVAAMAVLDRAGSTDAPARYGGAFAVEDADGGVVTEADFARRPYAVFFGFTRCPDVCPATLAMLAGLVNDLGPAAAGMDFWFVSVDPARDTPQDAQAYAAAFSPRIVGLSGSPDAVAAMARGFGIHQAVSALPDGGYTVDHTGSVLLVDRAGRLAATLGTQDTHDAALATLRRIAGS